MILEHIQNLRINKEDYPEIILRVINRVDEYNDSYINFLNFLDKNNLSVSSDSIDLYNMYRDSDYNIDLHEFYDYIYKKEKNHLTNCLIFYYLYINYFDYTYDALNCMAESRIYGTSSIGY